jgi:molybdate transport system substrate-binding protein
MIATMHSNDTASRLTALRFAASRFTASRRAAQLFQRLAVATATIIAAVVPSAANDLTVFAAVSTTNAMTDIAKVYEKKGLGKVRLSFNATSTLARQIEAGAPADLFVSADEPWMNYLQERSLIDPATRKALFGNALSLVAKSDSPLKLKIEPNFPLAASLKNGRLAVGDPDHTAVGVYAKQALTKLGVWKEVEPRLARAPSVRAGLTMVERGEVALGIVFKTEVKIGGEKVRIVDTFPADTHEPIVYPLAVLPKGRVKDARKFVEFLSSPDAKAILDGYGFVSF